MTGSHKDGVTQRRRHAMDIWMWVQVYLLYLLAVAVHEAGHTLAAALLGNTTIRRLLVDGPAHPAPHAGFGTQSRAHGMPPRPRDVALTRSDYRTA